MYAPPHESTDRWHVLLAHPREERKAAASLIGHRIPVYLPEITERVRHGRGMIDRLKPMFPGYLFMPVTPQINWGRIRATPGIRYTEGEGVPALLQCGRIATVPGAAMQIVMAKEGRLHKGLERRPDALRVGQDVEAVDGPFAWFKGVIENIERLDTQGRLKVGMDIFGRLVSVEFEVSQVRAV